MKKNKIVIMGIGIIGIVILIITGIVCCSIFNNQSIEYLQRYSTIGNISQVTAMIISGINLFAILYFFYFDKRDKIEDNKILSKAHWFNDFIYEKNMVILEEFFIELKEIVAEANSISKDIATKEFNSLIKIKFDSISEKILNILETFVSLIEVMDEELSENLNDIIMKLQDELTVELEKCACTDTCDICKEIILKYRKEIIKILYNYNISIYNR